MKRFDYSQSIFSPDPINVGEWTHSGYINFKRIYDYLKTQKTELKILDIGSGAGAMIASLQKYFPQHDYYGSDISPKAIKYGKTQFSNINLQIASSDKLPFSDSSFDIIIISEVLEHVTDYKKSLKEATRVLKTRGILYLTSPLEKSLLTIQGLLLKSFGVLLSNTTTGHTNTFTKKDLFSYLKINHYQIFQETYSQHIIWQILLTIYQSLLILFKKDISLHRPPQNSKGFKPQPIFGIIIKAVAFVTNIESEIFKKIPGSDIQLICKKS